jgi:hypothetical protein
MLLSVSKRGKTHSKKSHLTIKTAANNRPGSHVELIARRHQSIVGGLRAFSGHRIGGLITTSL